MSANQYPRGYYKFVNGYYYNYSPNEQQDYIYLDEYTDYLYHCGYFNSQYIGEKYCDYQYLGERYYNDIYYINEYVRDTSCWLCGKSNFLCDYCHYYKWCYNFRHNIVIQRLENQRRHNIEELFNYKMQQSYG